MKPQKVPNSQTVLRKKTTKVKVSYFLTSHYIITVEIGKERESYGTRNEKGNDQWNIHEDPEINLHVY